MILRVFLFLAWTTPLLTPVAAQTLRVAAASNLTVLEAPLQQEFARQFPGRTLQFTFGSTGLLAVQLLNGAPFAAFLAADLATPQKLVDEGLTEGAVIPYAVGQLIFLSTTPLGPGESWKTRAARARFSMASPEAAPFGRAAMQALEAVGLGAQIPAHAVIGQNATQALQFALTVGAGFVSRSALESPALEAYQQQGKYWQAVDPALYDPLLQGFVLMKAPTPAEGAAGRAFASFAGSEAVRKLLVRAGYGIP